MKRAFDVVASFLGLLVFSPLIVVFMILIWLGDRGSPFYMAPRAGKNAVPFRMFKLRSMTLNADRMGGSSTAANDRRVTPVGAIVRKIKLDEITQLWNVLVGDMSLVGPRPQVLAAVAGYSPLEKRLVSVRPGITDISSIVFADEGEILRGHADPDLAYEQLIRPWKSRLGLLYIERRSMALDLQLILATIVTLVSRKAALAWTSRLVAGLGADAALVEVCERKRTLTPCAPPGMTEIVQAPST